MTLCSFCNSTKHSVDRCFERLQIDAGGKCPRCNTVGHHWKKCPISQQMICEFCKSRGHVKEACFHLRKLIDNRHNKGSFRRLSADSDKNWRQRSSSDSSEISESPRKPIRGSCLTTQGTTAGGDARDRLKNDEATGLGEVRGRRASASQDELDQSGNSNTDMSLTIAPDGSITIKGGTSDIVGILLAANLNKTGAPIETTLAQSQPSRSDAAEDFSSYLDSIAPLIRNNLLDRIGNKTKGVNDNDSESSAPSTDDTQSTSGVPLSTHKTQAVRPKVRKILTGNWGPSGVVFSSTNRATKPLSATDNDSHQISSGGPPLTEENYIEQLQLYHNDLWPTFTPFECPNCGILVDTFEGVILNNCQVHKSCRECLRTRILQSPIKEVTCPQYSECRVRITESAILELLADEEAKEAYRAKPHQGDAENDTSLLQTVLWDEDLLPNLEAFECPVCLEEIPPGAGVIPKDCGIHKVCNVCLRGAINNSDRSRVNCPAEDCDAYLQDREVQLLCSPEEYQALLKKGLQHAIAEAMQCLTPDCVGAWFVENEGDGRFACPECKKLNCSKCKVIHENGQSCEQYKAEVQTKEHEDASKAYLEQRLKDGFAMICPKCKAIVEKVDGCDGITCRVCGTELCWATKGYRWGPGGKGDWEGGGCRCWVDGKKCAPHCQNCH